LPAERSGAAVAFSVSGRAAFVAPRHECRHERRQRNPVHFPRLFRAATVIEVVSSSPLVPRNDPTLMFTNAGMVQFKNVFTGIEKRPYSRAVDRPEGASAPAASTTTSTMSATPPATIPSFEMLGNFSFGDYFKEQAISHAWRLVTKEFGLVADRSSSSPSTPTTRKRRRCGARSPASAGCRIIRIGTSDNFWADGRHRAMRPLFGDFLSIRAGPRCGAVRPAARTRAATASSNSGISSSCSTSNCPTARASPLPKPSIDTGMGLERIAAILQGVHSNYDIDLFRALIRASADLTGVDADGPQKASHRVIADHLRASAFLVADGVLPSNEGRGYVLRRIMRRAMRHAELLAPASR
jgi:alanyl-tRNA synthetase